MQQDTKALADVDDQTRVAYIAVATFAPSAWQFAAVTGEGPVAKLAEFPPNVARHRRDRAAALLERARQQGIRAIVPGDEEWPHQVEDLNRDGAALGAPLCLWAQGSRRLPDVQRSILVTGAAAATPYGKHVAQTLGSDLADGRYGWTIANGGRPGIDTAAINGASVAIDRAPRLIVLPHGIAYPHPHSRADVYETVAAEGLVVSAFAPDAEPSRIARVHNMQYLAALTEATVIVEALPRSACLSAARRAKSLNRPVLAIPGPATSYNSAGCHELIRDGVARLVTGSPDITAELADRDA